MDYDVKVYSLMGGHAHLNTARKPADSTTVDFALAHSNKFLAAVAKRAEIRRPWAAGQFRALVVSLGGLMEKETATEITRWRKEMKDTVWDRMMARVSLTLLRARSKVYEG